jgi:hypothetical protein
MDRILAGLDFIFVYLDDIVIGSCSMEKHLQHLRVLFQRFQAAGLVINQEKSVFGDEEVEFLGHHVNATGVEPIASHVADILEHPQPTTVKELQGFLGVITFYHHFVPAAPHILKPLTDQLKGNHKPSAALFWTAKMQVPLWQPKQPFREVAGSSIIILEQRFLC